MISDVKREERERVVAEKRRGENKSSLVKRLFLATLKTGKHKEAYSKVVTVVIATLVELLSESSWAENYNDADKLNQLK